MQSPCLRVAHEGVLPAPLLLLACPVRCRSIWLASASRMQRGPNYQQRFRQPERLLQHMLDRSPDLPRDFSSIGIVKTDLTNGEIIFRDFHIHCPAGPGLGISINADALRDMTRKA